jgi:hypothetical protein
VKNTILVVGGLMWFGTFFIVPIILGIIIIPTDELHHFSEGLKPPTRKLMANGLS